MWSFLTRNRSVNHRRAFALNPSSPRRRSSVQLRLEQLETRFCPSGATIDAFSAYIPNIGRQVELLGTVEDADEGSTVSFAGAVSGSTTIDDLGRFDAVFTASGLGLVTASCGDADRTIGLSVVPPVVSLNDVVYGSQKNRTVTISGSVSAAPQNAGLLVTLSGAVSGFATTNGSGGFTYQGNARSRYCLRQDDRRVGQHHIAKPTSASPRSQTSGLSE